MTVSSIFHSFFETSLINYCLSVAIYALIFEVKVLYGLRSEPGSCLKHLKVYLLLSLICTKGLHLSLDPY
ncbi:unnamed protein product [Allacma fusca]|uniref:Uncharacterized protein n=1 Tax=Allacma fusca TaxID=39272 RepID=A0A8J2LKV4_9HEXA|nr:unnamed protein product [Allacma fusca]